MANPEFKEFNKLNILITGSKVNTPEDLETLLKLLDERDVEIRRLAKVFDLEHLLEGKVTWNLEVSNKIKGKMSKDEAIQQMLRGEKVTHTYFSDKEWITMEEGKVLTEEGYKFPPSDFWKYKQHPNFDKGWSIWKEKSKRVLGDYDIWYKPCVHCGYDTGKSDKLGTYPRCWKCGRQIFRDWSERALKKKP